MVSQFPGVLQLHHFKQRIFNDRKADAGGNIRQWGPFLLGLLHPAVHEHGAAGTQVNGRFAVHGLVREFRGGHAQALGKVFNKGTAACGTGFVQGNFADIAVVDQEAFHVLAADVQHAGDLGTELVGSPVVGKGLYLSRVCVKGSLYDLFPVTGGKAAGNIRCVGHGFVQARQFFNDDLQGRALVAAVIRI